MQTRNLQDLTYIRARLVDLLKGDTNVDLGSLTYLLNEIIGQEGGSRIPVSSESRFFQEKE
jgi:hypothetical protein